MIYFHLLFGYVFHLLQLSSHLKGIQNMEQIQISYSCQAATCAYKREPKPKDTCPLLKCPNEIIRNISDYLKLADRLTLMRASRNCTVQYFLIE